MLLKRSLYHNNNYQCHHNFHSHFTKETLTFNLFLVTFIEVFSTSNCIFTLINDYFPSVFHCSSRCKNIDLLFTKILFCQAKYMRFSVYICKRKQWRRCQLIRYVYILSTTASNLLASTSPLYVFANTQGTYTSSGAEL